MLTSANDSSDQQGGLNDIVDDGDFSNEYEHGEINLVVCVQTARKQIGNSDGLIKIHVVVNNNQSVLALVDTGASLSVISQSWLTSHI